MTYIQKENDLKFRRVNTANLEEEEFGNFTSKNVDYLDGIVVEVLHRDGTTHIEYGEKRKVVSVNSDGNYLYFPFDLPRARLWLQDSGGVCYKIPMKLQERDRNAYVLVPGGFRNVRLCGDPYFETVYELKRNY